MKFSRLETVMCSSNTFPRRSANIAARQFFPARPRKISAAWCMMRNVRFAPSRWMFLRWRKNISPVRLIFMELKFILESLLFSAQKPLSVKELRDVLASAAEHEDADATAKSLAKTREGELTAALEQLAREHETAARSYRLACVAGSWQFVTQPEFSPWLRDELPRTGDAREPVT